MIAVHGSLKGLASACRFNDSPGDLPLGGKIRPAGGAARARFIQVGVDVAGPGEDETARVGGTIITQQAWSLPDPRGELVAALGRLN